MDDGTTPLEFHYDGAGRLYAILNGSSTFWPVWDGQGNVAGLINASGTQVVSYKYDAWGNIVSTTDTSGKNMAALNPFRYRGYFWDAETGLYYLNSRYYDPVTKRFINADALLGADPGMGSYNLFAYCGNNPVMASDPSGYIHILIEPGDGFSDLYHDIAYNITYGDKNDQAYWVEMYNRLLDSELFASFKAAEYALKALKMPTSAEASRIYANNKEIDYRAIRLGYEGFGILAGIGIIVIPEPTSKVMGVIAALLLAYDIGVEVGWW